MNHSTQIKEISSQLHSTIFKKLKFNKNGNHFCYWNADKSLAQLVTLQVGQQSILGNYTINYSYYIPIISHAFGNKSIEKPIEIDGHIRSRIGFLLPNKNDRWYSFTMNSNVVIEDIQKYLSPLFEESNSVKLLIANYGKIIENSMTTGRLQKIYYAILIDFIGQRTEAIKQFTNLIMEEEKINSKVRPSILRIIQNLGIKI